MAIIVEYLVLTENAGTFCDSVDAFNRLLQLDSALSFNKQTLRYKTICECAYNVTTGEGATKGADTSNAGSGLKAKAVRMSKRLQNC